ncbi:MAG: DUF72 domain-containing protein [bacterium]|nr:DUF72 domain-containing protein [bacterium]
MASACTIRCGPAGWSYPHWQSVVYPKPKPRGFHPLEYLSRYVDTIEINTWFHRPPRPEVARLWVRKVEGNPRFTFTAKLHRRFTHDRVVAPADVEVFSRGLRVLQAEGKLGCVLMQFPWSFRFTGENRDFFIRLRRAFAEFPLAAEMRHGSWTCEEALGVFIDYHVGFANIDQPAHTRATPPTALLTSGVGYVRLHGRGYGDWFRRFDEPPAAIARRDYLYSLDELTEWKERIERIRRFADSLYIITNNDRGGRSVVNALQMQAIHGLGSRIIPRALARAYRRELGEFSPDAPVQDTLFNDARAVA